MLSLRGFCEGGFYCWAGTLEGFGEYPPLTPLHHCLLGPQRENPGTGSQRFLEELKAAPFLEKPPAQQPLQAPGMWQERGTLLWGLT